jgi:hypothetical protein
MAGPPAGCARDPGRALTWRTVDKIRRNDVTRIESLPSSSSALRAADGGRASTAV